MYPKNSIVTLLLAISCICTFSISGTSATHCSLDRMRKFAMDACEHLFKFETEVRERRSIGSVSRNSHTAKHWIDISRGIYPVGGYLKVGPEHYNKLSLLDVSPRYKAKKFAHIMREKKMRHKREDKDYHNFRNNISYCCYHKCEEDFFC